MDAVSSCTSSTERNRDIERLTEVFGASLSLEAIASAYSQARNVELAGLILYELQGTTSAMVKESKDEKDEACMLSSELSTKDTSDSGISTEECLGSTLLGNGSIGSQPFEVQSSSVQQSSSVLSTCGKDDGIDEDIGEFLFQMLGDAFQLDMKKIHEVLGLCGYDLKKSMETLVDLSASSLVKCNDVVSGSAEKGMNQEIGSYVCSQKPKLSDSPGPRLVKQNGKKPRNKNKDKSNLQREILESLFSASERVEEEQPKRITHRRRVSGSSLYGRTVAEPLKETEIDQSYVSVRPVLGSKEDEADENSFSVLRQAVGEYWVTMKQYYEAAADAYTKGDKVLAYKLMKEGQFFNKKAREADEQSSQKLLETRDEELLLDFSTMEPREAIKLLRLHLSNLAGIPSIRYLKVNVGNYDGQSQKGSCKRLVLKLLAKESIEWTESENGETIVIRLEEINPKTLSFVKKPELISEPAV